MSEVDQKKRKLLKLAGVWGAAGIVGGATPFISSLYPNRSAQLKGKPINVDVSGMNTGEQKTVMWRGKPIWIVKRDKNELSGLSKLTVYLVIQTRKSRSSLNMHRTCIGQ